MLHYSNHSITSETDICQCLMHKVKIRKKFSVIQKTSKFFTVAISTLLLMALVSCGYSKNEPKKAYLKSGTPYSVGRLENTGYGYEGSGDFSNGYAFVRLSYCEDPGFDASNRSELIGCINTNGDLQYCVERQDYKSYYVKNGRMQILENISTSVTPKYDRWICLDEEGKVCYEYDVSSKSNGIESYIICGGSYILVAERETGFETSDNFTYRIIDDNGDTVLEYNDTFTEPYYYGCGIFFLDSNNAGHNMIGEHGNVVLYNADIDAFFETASPLGSELCYNCVDGGVLSLSDGTYIELYKYIDYDSIVYEEYMFEDIAENGFLIYKKDTVPFIFDFRNNVSYDCFSDISNHKTRFLHHDDKIAAIVRGDDSNIYLKIVDKNGNIIKELTKLEYSNCDLDSISYVFYDDKLELSYISSNTIIVCNADLGSGELSYEVITEKGKIMLLSDYYDGIAKNTFYDYYSSGMNRKVWNYHNYVNRDGQFFFDVDKFNQPIINVNDSEILNFE